jgi:hypothetical protein
MIDRVLLALLAAGFLSAASSTEFARHPAAPRLKGRPATPKLVTKQARLFRTRLRQEAAEGPNFNGHYRVASWGCGTNCIEWAVIDLLTGDVWTAPEEASSCWAVDASPEANSKGPQDWFEMHVDSSLLYLHICAHPRTDRPWDTREVYVWSLGAPRLLRTESISE